jgi:hypothetical protein
MLVAGCDFHTRYLFPSFALLPTSHLQFPILYDIHPLATPLSRVTVACGGAVSWWRLLAANMSTHDRSQRTSRSASRHRLSLSNQS